MRLRGCPSTKAPGFTLSYQACYVPPKKDKADVQQPTGLRLMTTVTNYTTFTALSTKETCWHHVPASSLQASPGTALLGPEVSHSQLQDPMRKACSTESVRTRLDART